MVVQTELVGPDLYLLAKLSDGTEMACRCDAGAAFSVGETVHLLLEEQRIHLFDRQSGICVSHGGGNSNPT